jgi:alkylation response protein AidB-like acyl-CoA dehydrogenase
MAMLADAPPTTKALDRVAGLAPIIRRGGDEAQKLRRLPQDTVDALIDAGFFRFALPTEVGGENASSMETIAVLEALAAIDASVGWNVMLGSEINAMAVGGMDPALGGAPARRQLRGFWSGQLHQRVPQLRVVFLGRSGVRGR